MTDVRHILKPALAAVVVCLVAAVHAAPATSGSSADDETQAQQRVPANRSAMDPNAVGEMQGSSKTIQMLLELQGGKPTLESGDRANTGRGDLPTPKRPAQPSGPLQPFGAGATPFAGPVEKAKPTGMSDVQSAANVDWQQGAAGRGLAGGDMGSTRSERSRNDSIPQSSDNAPPQGPSAVPWLADALRVLRENREIVLIGSLVAIALVWLSAAKAGQKRR